VCGSENTTWQECTIGRAAEQNRDVKDYVRREQDLSGVTCSTEKMGGSHVDGLLRVAASVYLCPWPNDDADWEKTVLMKPRAQKMLFMKDIRPRSPNNNMVIEPGSFGDHYKTI
jgi:hypothetical protein